MGNSVALLSNVSTTESVADGMTMASASDVENILNVVRAGVNGVLGIASTAFSFLMSNPLCAFMVTIGFAYTALGLVRKGLKIAKRT